MWARIWFIALAESIAYTYTFWYYKQWDIVRASQETVSNIARDIARMGRKLWYFL